MAMSGKVKERQAVTIYNSCIDRNLDIFIEILDFDPILGSVTQSFWHFRGDLYHL